MYQSKLSFNSITCTKCFLTFVISTIVLNVSDFYSFKLFGKLRVMASHVSTALRVSLFHQAF